MPVGHLNAVFIAVVAAALGRPLLEILIALMGLPRDFLVFFVFEVVDQGRVLGRFVDIGTAGAIVNRLGNFGKPALCRPR